MKKTSQRSLLFRQNVGRTEEEWAHFLDGYRQVLSLRLDFGRGGRGGEEGRRERAADVFAAQGSIATKMKSAQGACPLGFAKGTTLHLVLVQYCGPKMALCELVGERTFA